MTKYYLQILLNVTIIIILVLSYVSCSSHIFNKVLNTIRYALMSATFRMDGQTGVMWRLISLTLCLPENVMYVNPA